jgi:hypothetical protein
MEVIVVVRQHLHDRRRSCQARARPDEDAARSGLDEAIDEVLRGAPAVLDEREAMVGGRERGAVGFLGFEVRDRGSLYARIRRKLR